MDTNFIRKQFPALKNDFIFMDNAGGSQTLQTVIDKISEFLIHYDVQLGASYPVSASAGEKLNQTVKNLAGFINAEKEQEVIIGPSTTMLLRILSLCISRQWQAGDEVIVTNSDHEANVSCWMDLQARGIKVKLWKINPETLEFDLEDLQKLLSKKTQLVAMVHASNILGTINPIRQVSEIVHQAGALLCVDGVAYAPHRLIDVQELDVDFYSFSTYKTFGPHQAVMYGRYDLLSEMDGINHYFIGKDEVPYKFQPGNVNYELTYSLSAIPEYLAAIQDHHSPAETELPLRARYEKGYNLIAEHEEDLGGRLLDYLGNKKNIKIIGHRQSDKNKRVATISFIHEQYKSPLVVNKVDDYGIGIRFGDFYAKKIIHDLDLEKKDGVIRVSMVHYNTMEEVDAIINAFEEIL